MPKLPSVVRDLPAQRNFDALNSGVGNLENRFPVATADIADDAVTDAKLASPVIVGQVSSAGAVVVGSGFTSKKTGTGAYEITLTTELASEGVMGATSSEFNRLPRITAAGKKVFKVAFVDLSEVAGDTAFHFHVKPS